MARAAPAPAHRRSQQRHGEELNRATPTPPPTTQSLWELPEAHHVGGLQARPEEYERRVVGFFDEALAR